GADDRRLVLGPGLRRSYGGATMEQRHPDPLAAMAGKDPGPGSKGGKASQGRTTRASRRVSVPHDQGPGGGFLRNLRKKGYGANRGARTGECLQQPGPSRPLRCAAMLRPLALLALLLTPPAAAEVPLTALPFPRVQVQDAFWGPRLATNRKVTVEANLRQCEATHRIRNFAVAGKKVEGKHVGLLFNDSDVYKAIEGIASTLTLARDAGLERRADAIIDLIAAAQQPDGYLNTYYTLARPKERWRNIQHGHELYCAGHLIEAAVAYHQATG